MDPYLEHPAIWPNMHHQLISQIEAELNLQLRPKYFANVENRVYLSDENDPGHDIVIPHVHILSRQTAQSIASQPASGNVATIEPIEITTIVEDQVHEARVEIVDRLSRAVVTVIEILSPTNKLNGSYGRESYQGKRREVLSSASHLIEIDLLRAGLRMFIQEPPPAFDYVVHVSRAEGIQRRATFWPIPIQSPLPVVPVPLKKEDSDGHLDLQRLLDTAYDRGAFDLKVITAPSPCPRSPLIRRRGRAQSSARGPVGENTCRFRCSCNRSRATGTPDR
jgi:hypothetical protein